MPDGNFELHEPKAQRLTGARAKRDLDVRIVRNLEDMMKVTVVRSTVYMCEQSCPYDEEFDGNDFCSTHLLGLVDGEPASCLRLRCFSDFAKIERLATRQEFRRTRITDMTVRAGFEHLRRKGYSKIVGHAQDRLVPFWSRYGFRVTEESRRFVFSDFSYTEIIWEKEQHEDAIRPDTDPYRLIRPEGDWDRPGILERSLDRSLQGGSAMAIAAE